MHRSSPIAYVLAYKSSFDDVAWHQFDFGVISLKLTQVWHLSHFSSPALNYIILSPFHQQFTFESDADVTSYARNLSEVVGSNPVDIGLPVVVWQRTKYLTWSIPQDLTAVLKSNFNLGFLVMSTWVIYELESSEWPGQRRIERNINYT
jgi:hypothetical protein